MSERSNDQKKSGRRASWAWISIFLFFVLVISLGPVFLTGPQEISLTHFEENILARGATEKIVIINKEVANIYIRPEFALDTAFSEAMKSPLGDVKPGPHYSFNIGSVESFERMIEGAKEKMPDKGIEVVYEQTARWTGLITWILPIVILFFLMRFLFVQRGGPMGSPFSFGSTTAKLFESDEKSNVTFEQVAGLQEAKTEVMEIVDFLKDPKRYVKLGAKIPKGVIIVGPPGTGKTLLARAVAGEAQVPFFSLSGSEFVEMFVGVGASRVRDLFRRAKEKAPCIVFIDEIDAVGRSRGRNALYSGSNDERESTLNQLLTEMDGFGTNSGVIVLAATNRGDILDPALLRPGRFDRHIYLELPNQAERNAIFKVHLRPLTIDSDVKVDEMAQQTPGFSGADIANICNEGALIAARQRKEKIGQMDFQSAIDRIVGGLEKKSKIISAEEKQIVAVHESGHAVVSWLLDRMDPLLKVSIIPRGKSLGAAWYLPAERQIRSATYYKQHLASALAGRAAEEVVFNEISSGAVDDLEKCTKEAYAMVTYLGFDNKLGIVSYFDSTGRSEYAVQKPYSEETAGLIDNQVRSLLDECYAKARSLLVANRSALIRMADLLMKTEVITGDDIAKILGPRPVKKVVSLGLPSDTEAPKPGRPLLTSLSTQ